MQMNELDALYNSEEEITKEELVKQGDIIISKKCIQMINCY